MKILHTADLHIGKLVNGFSMLSDQKYILEEILKITDRGATGRIHYRRGTSMTNPYRLPRRLRFLTIFSARRNYEKTLKHI